jgi:hypothetical protein|tara:strand:- start:1674 stop:2042 length:369 start_codon:yes stop_codon:yes gene_type:complete
MLRQDQLEDVFLKARQVALRMPVTYQHLMGHERLAVLPILKEPIQSTLHAILQQNVRPGTRCFYKGCGGDLDRTGLCSENCSRSGSNAINDIMTCNNCDSYSFPCPTCNCVIFNDQLKMYLD